MGYNPANFYQAPDDFNPIDWWSRFFTTLDYLKNEASDEEYWEAYEFSNGWPIPKRTKDSWWDRFKHGKFYRSLK